MKIKLMSFNIQHGRNHNLPGDVIDLPLMAKTILDVSPDFVGLQEVFSDISGTLGNQPAILSSITGGTEYFGKAMSFDNGKDYGNAVISYLPIDKFEVIPIPDPIEKLYESRYYETRCIMKMSVNCDGKPLTLLVTHFGLNPDEKENAVDTVIKTLDSCTESVILMGDLNMSPCALPLQHLSKHLTDTAAALQSEEMTSPSHKPEWRIDYFWHRGVKPLSINTYKKVVSDHLPLIAEFEI